MGRRLKLTRAGYEDWASGYLRDWLNSEFRDMQDRPLGSSIYTLRVLEMLKQPPKSAGFIKTKYRGQLQIHLSTQMPGNIQIAVPRWQVLHKNNDPGGKIEAQAIEALIYLAQQKRLNRLQKCSICGRWMIIAVTTGRTAQRAHDTCRDARRRTLRPLYNQHRYAAQKSGKIFNSIDFYNKGYCHDFQLKGCKLCEKVMTESISAKTEAENTGLAGKMRKASGADAKPTRRTSPRRSSRSPRKS